VSTIDGLPETLRFILPLAWFLGAYLLGSVPVAWLLARWVTGQDLRRLGSGNVGVMNTAFSVARWAGLTVFLTEIGKGLLVVTIPRLVNASDEIVFICLLAAVAGTRWPIWLRFKGGRGNSTGLSGLTLISSTTMMAVVSLWVLARLLLHSSFKATRLTFAVMPLLGGLISESWMFFFALLALSIIYLLAQQPGRDDHSRIVERWSSFPRFLISPPRRGKGIS
jgi:acyl phosphate:glycerol-3-phosphate acyltransferase